jgi:hypothetical protein
MLRSIPGATHCHEDGAYIRCEAYNANLACNVQPRPKQCICSVTAIPTLKRHGSHRKEPEKAKHLTENSRSWLVKKRQKNVIDA